MELASHDFKAACLLTGRQYTACEWITTEGKQHPQTVQKEIINEPLCGLNSMIAIRSMDVDTDQDK